MLKMEKNFRGQDKGYVRMPPDSSDINELHSYIYREMAELDESLTTDDTVHIREEIADVINCLEYLYETVLRKEIAIALQRQK